MLAKISEAPKIWNQLNGLVNIYKPSGVKIDQLRNSILGNLCRDLNNLDVRQPSARVVIESCDDSQKYLVRREVNLADHVLAVGPRHQMKDFRFGVSAGLGFHTSGVLIVGINDGLSTATKIQLNRPLRVYHVTGRLGTATESHFFDSRIVCKASYRHIRADRFGAMIASLQSSHQRKMYEMCGVDMQSQAAYEIASKGVFRPADNSLPVIFGMKLIHFRPPEFTLEIHAMNESEKYLAALINDIAIEQRTVAFCSTIRCIRHGHFDVENSVLRRHWTLEGILSSMAQCREVLAKHPSLLRKIDPELSPD